MISIDKLKQDNRTLRQKNTYFTKEVPKLKTRIDKLNLLADKQREEHTKLMRAKDHELLKMTEMYDQLHAEFNIISGLKMQELLGGVMIDRL